MRYIKLIIEADKLHNKTDVEKLDEEEINEFSGVSAIAGYTGPLGGPGLDDDDIKHNKPYQKITKKH
jgi:hypothetical protein